MATSRNPLRSKRAMISPDRFRAKASGLIRIRVRSMGLLGPRRRSPAPYSARETLERTRIGQLLTPAARLGRRRLGSRGAAALGAHGGPRHRLLGRAVAPPAGPTRSRR